METAVVNKEVTMMAREVAKELMNGICPMLVKHGWAVVPSITRHSCEACVEQAILSYARERLEEAAKIAEDHAIDYSAYQSRLDLVCGIAQVIREMAKEMK